MMYMQTTHILCKIFPHFLFGGAFSLFSQLQQGSLTCWEDIKNAFLIKLFREAAATRHRKLDYMLDKMIDDQEKELMSSFSQMLGVVYNQQKGEFETMSTHIKKPDIQVQQADDATASASINTIITLTSIDNTTSTSIVSIDTISYS